VFVIQTHFSFFLLENRLSILVCVLDNIQTALGKKKDKVCTFSHVACHMLFIPAFGKQRFEQPKFKASLGCMSS
jgi:hypothetical protein